MEKLVASIITIGDELLIGQVVDTNSAWMAQEFGVRYVGHGWNTALGLAADLQLASAFPDCDLVEYIGGSAYVDRLTREPFALDGEGYLAIPDRPGLGIELEPEHLARYTPDPAAFFAG